MAAQVHIIGTYNGRVSEREWHGTLEDAWAHIDGQSKQLELANYSVRWDSDNNCWDARRVKDGALEVITIKATAVQS